MSDVASLLPSRGSELMGVDEMISPGKNEGMEKANTRKRPTKID